MVLILILLCVGIFFKVDGAAKAKRIYYGHVVRQAYHREYKNLATALGGLGLSENKDIKSKCEITEIATDGANVSKVLFCGLQSDSYIEVNAANKQHIVDAARQLDDLAKQYGGRMYTNTGPTFGKYLTDITNGVDYYPDFGVTFVRDNYLCEVHMNVAYAKPKPPAYSIQFGCNSPRLTKNDNYLAPPKS